jgi:hypothetical protein
MHFLESWSACPRGRLVGFTQSVDLLEPILMRPVQNARTANPAVCVLSQYHAINTSTTHWQRVEMGMEPSNGHTARDGLLPFISCYQHTHSTTEQFCNRFRISFIYTSRNGSTFDSNRHRSMKKKQNNEQPTMFCG